MNRLIRISSIHINFPIGDIRDIYFEVDKAMPLNPTTGTFVLDQQIPTTIDTLSMNCSFVNIRGGVTFNRATFCECIFNPDSLRHLAIYRYSRFRGCLFFIDADLLPALFESCTFTDCTFVVGDYAKGSTHTGKPLFVGNCQFIDADFKPMVEFTNYYDPAVIHQQGGFTAWKKVGGINSDDDELEYILELRVPPHAQRVRSMDRGSEKIRVSEAHIAAAYHVGVTVDDIHILGAKLTPAELADTCLFSYHNSSYKYTVGKTAFPDSFEENVRLSCTNGIHCFVNQQTALDYV